MSIFSEENVFNDFIEKIGKAAQKICKDMRDLTLLVGDITRTSWYVIKHPSKLRWRDVGYYMDLCGSQALPIVIMICFLMGLILAFQAAVQARKFGGEIFVADAVGFSILKELGPLMVAMIATGRAGSAFAAEIGTMKVNEEISALETMGFSPTRFLVIPKLVAMLIAMPVLTVFGDVSGLFGGFIVGITMLGLPGMAYYTRTIAVLHPSTMALGLIKSIVFGILIAIVGCLRGFQSESDAQGVGRSTTSSVVTSIFMIVIADSVLTMLYTFLGY
ncbi:ABC transporter permease [Lentisphaerota bacterium ZTH]|nr:ABC transporter permease [Lentisphaerota bacterium]WET06705.1 ABC transporter permease [Lentisphaerota bacterium ZTH]